MTIKDYTLDSYEQEIQDHMDSHEFIPLENESSVLHDLQQAVKSKYSKRRSISIRPLEHDIETIKVRAMEEGIPYQTLMNSILHKYATGKLVENK